MDSDLKMAVFVLFLFLVAEAINWWDRRDL